MNGTGSASINASGLLTAITNGTVTVIATANDGSGVSGSMIVTISNQLTLVSAIMVNSVSGSNIINQNLGTLQLVANVLPANASNPNVTWSIVNGTGVATISPTGLVTANANGTVTAVATSTDGTNISGTMIITISNQLVFTEVSNINVTSLSNSVFINNTLQMYKVVTPAFATNQSVNWSVVNGSGAATISATGILTGTIVGVVTVLATAVDGSGTVGSKLINVIPSVTLGIKDFDASNIVLSPNPFVNQIALSNLMEEDFHYEITNVLGQRIATGKINKNENKIHLSSLQSGNYIIQLSSNEGKAVWSSKMTKL
jgi:uncharacterized protein YjdB